MAAHPRHVWSGEGENSAKRHTADDPRDAAKLTLGCAYLWQDWPFWQWSAWAWQAADVSHALTLQQAAAASFPALHAPLPHAEHAQASQLQASPTQQPQSAAQAPQGHPATLTKVDSVLTAVVAVFAVQEPFAH